ncbi:MAG: ATP-dependent DNA helicase [Candidatus Delongbacteria bacterium]
MPQSDSAPWPVLPEDLLSLPGDPAPQIPLVSAEEVFGPGGLLSQKLPDYQPRASQLTMAQEVELALMEGRGLMVEAPTGTGKSLAYSVPAIQHAMATGQRVLIATANIALQEQLTQKDLPFLQRVLPVPFRFALLKGRGNFLCADKLLEQRSMLFAGVTGEDQDEFDRVLDWANRTSTGDASELPFKVTPRVWRHFAVGDTAECAGCSLKCYHKAAVEEAGDAQVVVCNYHLLFAHLKVQAATGGMAGVLPEFNALVCDEAHEIPDIGSDFAGEEIGRWSFRGFKRHLSRGGYEALDHAAEGLSKAIKLMGFKHAAQGSNRIKLPGLIDEEPILDALRHAWQELRALQAQYEAETKEHAQLERQKEQCRQLGQRVKALVWQENPEWVYWVERQDGAAGESWKLKGKPVSIAPFLQRTLLPWVPVIATSATLTTTREDFTFIRERIGLDAGTRQVVLPSPFDFGSAALLVVPDGLPEPNDPAHRDRVHDELHKAVRASGGRALLLFTSSQALRAAHGLLAPEFTRMGYICHCQGDAPSTQLIARFKEDVSSVLFATRTFFQGVDVPGESLSLVALDRLPFPSPADPVMDYIAEHDPKGWFFKHSLPTALITWRQIFGRLIRRHDDRGVVLLLDGRVQSKKYGRQFLKAIPGGMLSREVASIESFLADPEDPFA